MISLSPLSPALLGSATLLLRCSVAIGTRVCGRMGDCGDVSNRRSHRRRRICRHCRLRVRGVSTSVPSSILDGYHRLSAPFLSARARASDNGDSRPWRDNPDTPDLMFMARASAALRR